MISATRKLLLLVLVSISTLSQAQYTDTLKVLSYNILNFPAVSPNRVDTLESILSYIKPDIFMACEITSGVGADNILYNALNVGGVTSYEMANWVDGPDTDNMLYYNSDKLVLKEQNQIATALRDISEYVLYYKSSDLSTTTDTTFFYVYMCHLKASQGFESQRNAEVTILKDYMATRPNLQNVIFGGDFNFYGSSIEPAWNTILNGSGVTLVDPINIPGDWHANSTYAPIHTQSPRTVSFDGGSTGGLDDRFDIIFISPDLNNWANDAKYITGTYRAIGQDGNHYNVALIDAPWNTSEPAPIIWNLYNMSDHLPVYMEVEVNIESMDLVEKEFGFHAFYNPDSNEIHFELTKVDHIDGPFEIYTISGSQVMSIDRLPENNRLSIGSLSAGVYVLRVQDFELKFVVD